VTETIEESRKDGDRRTAIPGKEKQNNVESDCPDEKKNEKHF